MGIINSFYISGGNVNVKITENSRPLAVTHLNVLQFISQMLICHHHQYHHSLGFVIRCVHIKYILLLNFFSSSFFLHSKIFFFCLFVFGYFWSSFLRKFQIIFKSKQRFYFKINVFFSYKTIYRRHEKISTM